MLSIARSPCFALWGGLLWFSVFCPQGYGQVELPDLPYGESDLEPYITAEVRRNGSIELRVCDTIKQIR